MIWSHLPPTLYTDLYPPLPVSDLNFSPCPPLPLSNLTPALPLRLSVIWTRRGTWRRRCCRPPPECTTAYIVITHLQSTFYIRSLWLHVAVGSSGNVRPCPAGRTGRRTAARTWSRRRSVHLGPSGALLPFLLPTDLAGLRRSSRSRPVSGISGWLCHCVGPSSCCVCLSYVLFMTDLCRGRSPRCSPSIPWEQTATVRRRLDAPAEVMSV